MESEFGSEDRFHKVQHVYVEWMMYDPIHAGSSIKLPDDIANTKCVLNIFRIRMRDALNTACMQLNMMLRDHGGNQSIKTSMM